MWSETREIRPASCYRDLALEDRARVPVGDTVAARVASQFIDVLAQSCANGNGKRRASGIARLN